VADRIRLSIVTPERKVFEEEVDEIVLPGSEGYLGVLPGHAPLLASLKIGELGYRQGTRWRYGFVAWGFAEVLPERVSILADLGELADEIDLERAKAARERAEQRLMDPAADYDHARARAALERAVGRMMVAGHK
jgi:F-type H+-transporting ATPase subunit epsilon